MSLFASFGVKKRHVIGLRFTAACQQHRAVDLVDIDHGGILRTREGDIEYCVTAWGFDAAPPSRRLFDK